MNRLTILSFIISLLYFNNVNAQFKFNVNLNTGNDSLLDAGNTVIELTGGSYLACGNLFSVFTNYSAAYLVKTDAHGDTLWAKQFDFAPNIGSDIFTDVKELPDKNYLLVGTTYDSIIQNSDVFLAKVDTNGLLLWFKKYSHTDNDQSAELEITPDNKIIILGNSTPNPNTTYNDVLLVKTDINGNLIWRKRFGNSYEEVYLTLEIIKNNTEYLLGGRYGYYNSGNPYFDMSIMRTDTAGNVIWQQQYGTPSGNEPAGSVIQTLDSGFVFSGEYNNQGAILKIDKNGSQQWIKYFALGADSWIANIKQLKDTSYVMIVSDWNISINGWTAYLIKTDKSGSVLWKRIYPGLNNISNYFYGFNLASDGGFIITGQYNHIGQPYQNLWVIKTDSLGCDSVACSFNASDNKIYSKEQKISIYPNPTTSILNIVEENNQLQNATIEIKNYLGQVVFTSPFLSQINLFDLSAGMYFLTIQDKDSRKTVKIIKQ